MSKINVIDIETYGRDKLIPYCCCIIYKNKKFVFYGDSCIEKMFEYVFNYCDDGTIFFAHNLTFDGLVLLNKLGNDVEISENGTLLKNCSIYSLTFKKNNKIIKYHCSAKILPLPLKDIAFRLKLPLKQEVNHDLINVENYKNIEIKNTIIDYCLRDVLITQKFLLKINDELKNIYPGWWIWCYTISGLALKIFDKNFNKKIKTSLSIAEDNCIRPAYYGGRCEVFGNPIKGDNIFHFDFSGMYTNRLKEKFPYGDFSIEIEPNDIEKIGFYSVVVDSNINLIPILPYRCKKTKKLLFPNGVFSGLYWHEELKLFIENGGKIKKIYWAAVFEKEDYVFKDFSEFCIKNRGKSDLNKILWKLIPNSFIGRLGLRNDYEKTIIVNDEDYNPLNYDLICDKKINNQWLVRINTIDKDTKTNNNVIYPSIITSKARILWWKNAQEVIKNGGRLLYCDTDSIFVSYNRNVIGEEHGDIKWIDNGVDTIIKDGCFAGNKVYSVVTDDKNIVKIKGVKTDKIDFDEFKNKFYESESINFTFDLFEKKLFNMRISEIIKKIKFSGYDKRIFDNNKKSTKPLYIIEDTLLNK